MSSAQYLADRFEDVPAYVIPVINETFEGDGAVFECSQLGSVLPAAWSFQLAARARGPGTCWTTLHLLFEKEVAEILGLPDDIHQAALITVGYYTGESFKPAPRWDMEQKIHWNGW